MNASLIPADPVGPADDDESALPMFWLSLFAAILIVGLLFAFQQVVHAAVDQAVSKRIIASAHADSVWRCKVVSQLAERTACLAQLSLQDQGDTGTAAVMQAAFNATAPTRP